MKVVVIGGGAAGMMAAITSARQNNEVIILEKTSSLGNKIKITGKGRCNITFDGDQDTFKENVVNNYRFLYSAFSKFDNNDVIKFFNDLGVKTKVERGGRIFPVSDDASEVVRALKSELKRLNVKVLYNSRVEKIIVDEKQNIQAVRLDNKKKINCDKCIIATGGASYNTTGSTGDGYKLLRDLGHNIIGIKPGLIPIKSDSPICKGAQGLSLKNVTFSIYDKEKLLCKDFGEMLFAHFGVTGPIVLSLSSKINRISNIDEKIKNKDIYGVIDLKPVLTEEMLDKRIQRDFEKYSNKEFKNSLNDLLPQKLISQVIKLSKIDENKKVHQITKEERNRIIKSIKEIKININGFLPVDMAIITCGGIDVKNVNPKTMESKLVSGLYICGEVLDIDALTGGFNLQIAFSTGYVAGLN